MGIDKQQFWTEKAKSVPGIEPGLLGQNATAQLLAPPPRRNPFDYILRTKEEVMQEFKYFAPEIPLKANYKRYLSGDVRENKADNLDNRERVAKVFIDIRDLKFAPLQRQRFQFLLGPRHDL